MLFLNILKTKATVSNMKILLHQSFRKLKDLAFEDVPVSEVSTATIKKNFKQYGLIYEEAYTCFIIRCTFCENEKKSKIYVNKNTGRFETSGYQVFENYMF